MTSSSLSSQTLKNDAMTTTPIQLSFVVPVHNEQENVPYLVSELMSVGDGLNINYELVIVDDGSSDGTVKALREQVQQHPGIVKVVELARNYGQSAALAAGFDIAEGTLIVPLDGDLQNDPHDVPNMINHLIENDLDVVLGWRKGRQDAVVSRKIPSYIANRIIGALTGLRFTDYGCALKVMRRDVAKSIQLYGELHRFIAFLAHMEGARIAEVPVNHRARQFGQSKYNLSRTLKVVMDLITLMFIRRFFARPLHMFGRLGFYSGLAGSLTIASLYVQKFAFGETINDKPAFMLGVLLILAGVQLISTGLLAEIQVRTFFKDNANSPYRIRSLFGIHQ